MAGTNLVVPLVLWGKSAPGHCVSCLYLLRDQRTMVTGSYDGQVRAAGVPLLRGLHSLCCRLLFGNWTTRTRGTSRRGTC